MAKYDVYGIGNALVDIDFEVDYDLLTQLKVEKGLMTLIDQERHHQLLHQLAEHKHIMACGGSAANTLIAVTQFGGKGYYSCKVASDASGDFFYEDLTARGLDTNLNGRTREQDHTGKCFVFVTPDADRTMNTYLGATESLSLDAIDEAALKNSEFLYIEGYLVTSESCRAAAIHARELANKHGIKTSITLSDPNITRFFGDGLRQMIGDRVDFLFCNEEEALCFTDKPNLKLAIDALKQYATHFAITRGSQGSVIVADGELTTIDAHPTHARDTVGAGDMYAGAFLYAITQGHDYRTAGELASLASARVVEKLGPRLSSEQCQSLLEEVKALKII